MQKISPMLWFDNEAEEAAKFYTSVFENSKITNTTHYTVETPSNKPVGSVLTVGFQIEGQDFSAINGGTNFKFTEAISLVITCEDQAEIDYYWERLSAVPEAEICGWLKDKYGVSWQVVPKDIDSLLMKSPAAMKALLEMKKIIINDLKKAAK